MAANVIAELEEEQRLALAEKRAVPDFAPGDTLRVSVFVREGERVRTQAFEGVCIARSGGETLNGGFTVRKISYNEGVERVFPLYSPAIESITVVRRGRVRRAKLYYLRDRRGKSARIAEKTNYKPRLGPGEDAATKRAEEEKAKAAADKEAAAAAKKAAAEEAEAAKAAEAEAAATDAGAAEETPKAD